MFIMHSTFKEQGADCLDVKMYEDSRNEASLVSHTQVYRDESGKLAERILFRRPVVADG